MSELRRIRINANLSTDELAAAADVSPETIRDIETGRSANPRARTLTKLASVLDVEAAALDPVLAAKAAA